MALRWGGRGKLGPALEGDHCSLPQPYPRRRTFAPQCHWCLRGSGWSCPFRPPSGQCWKYSGHCQWPGDLHWKGNRWHLFVRHLRVSPHHSGTLWISHPSLSVGPRFYSKFPSPEWCQSDNPCSRLANWVWRTQVCLQAFFCPPCCNPPGQTGLSED